MHVVITGGSSGIGLAIAKLYARRGASISLLARDAVKLRAAAAEIAAECRVDPSFIHTVSVDVAASDATMAAFKTCEARHGQCDILIASAGTVDPEIFETLSAERFNDQISTNVLGTANAVRAAYQGMVERSGGKIMIISSGAALIGIYGYTAYCASKAALTGFAEALNAESAGRGVTIAICYPPDTITPQYIGELPSRPSQAAFLMGKAKPWTAEAVAAKIVGGLDKGRTKIYFGFSIVALGYFGSLIKPILLWAANAHARKSFR